MQHEGKNNSQPVSNRTEKQMPKQETLMKGNIIHHRPTPHTRYHIHLLSYKNTTNKIKSVTLQVERLKIVSYSKLIHK